MTVLLAQQIEKIGGVAGVQQPKPVRQSDGCRVPAHKVVGHRVKRSSHHSARSGRDGNHGSGSLKHLPGRAASEGKEEDSLGGHPLAHEPGNPRTQGRRLSSTRTSENQEWTARMLNGGLLPRIEIGQPTGLGRPGRRVGRIFVKLEHKFPP
jgi:hypothetical protein